MIIELHVNGSLQIILTPVTTTEKSLVASMLELSKTKPLTLSGSGDTGKVIFAIDQT